MKWEYIDIFEYSTMGLMNLLQKYGDDGWELVNVIHHIGNTPIYYAYLKRERR